MCAHKQYTLLSRVFKMCMSAVFLVEFVCEYMLGGGAGVHMCMQVCVHVCVCVYRGQMLMSGVFL